MPSRLIVAKELAEVFKLLAHPDRIRLIEELRQDEQDVNSLSERLGLPATRVSQHLALLRAHRLVEERRDGRHHFYKLSQPQIAEWILEGIDVVEGRLASVPKAVIESAKQMWT